MDKQMLDIYSDYLIASFSYTTATGLSQAVSGMISHDKVTRFLSADDYDAKQLWKLVKQQYGRLRVKTEYLLLMTRSRKNHIQNHFFASIYAYCKLEMLKGEKKLNHFGLKAKLYPQALRASMAELQKLKLAT